MRCPVAASIHSVAVAENPPGEGALVLGSAAAEARVPATANVEKQPN